MKYQFFLREQPTHDGGSQSYLIIVPANTAEAMAQTTIQALVTRHQMHTCVNLPFGNGYKISFRLSYCEMDGSAHPLLVIFSNEFGAFKLPFEAGRKGYVHFHQTYNQLKIKLYAHHNSKLYRLANQNGQVKRLNHQQEMYGAAANQKKRPQKPGMDDSRRAANEPDATLKMNARNAPRRKASQRDKAAPPWLNLVKWTFATMIGLTVLIILMLGASSAFANEVETSNILDTDIKTDSQDKGFNGFPVPTMNLPMIKAKESTPCSVSGFGDASLPGLQTGSDNNEL